MLKIRLTRLGAKKAPFYRIVVADARAPREGRPVDTIGQYDATKQKIAEEARQNLAKKDQEIAKSVQDKAMEAAKAVGDAKGLSVVMTKDTVLYGGVDITDQVLKKLATDAKK